MAEPFKPSEQDVKNFLLGGVTVGAAFAGFKQVYDPVVFGGFLVLGVLTLLFRELGQRFVAHLMEADVDTGLSMEGAATTIAVAFFSYISVFNLAFLVPVFSSYSNKRYEHWGKSIDAIWAKRQYWLASSGILGLMLGWVLAYTLGFNLFAELIALFTFFQLLPLGENKPISGKLDGAYIILWTGFTWLIFTALTIIMMILSVL